MIYHVNDIVYHISYTILCMNGVKYRWDFEFIKAPPTYSISEKCWRCETSETLKHLMEKKTRYFQ